MTFPSTHRTKKEVADAMGIDGKTLANLLNVKHYDQLIILKYCKNDKLLNPKILEYLADHEGLNPEDF